MILLALISLFVILMSSTDGVKFPDGWLWQTKKLFALWFNAIRNVSAIGTAHSTRHTATTLSLLNGATLQQTQELLRHRNIGTTEIYAHNIDATTNPAANDVEEAIFGKSI